MAILDKLTGKPASNGLDPMRELKESEKQKAPPGVEERIKRGRDRMKEGSAKRNECLEFWRGNQYIYVSSENYLVKQGTVTNADGSGKPRHRVRTTRNIIFDIVAHEVSAATQRVPSYEVSAATTDPEDVSAARLAEKVALYGHDKWNVRHVTTQVVTYAVVADEGFAWPYFDNSIGPFIEGEGVGEGDVRIRMFVPNEVYWEPGIRFEDSRWHCVEQARPLEEVYAMEDYVGGKMTADAATSDIVGESQRKDAKLVLVTDYLERPSPKFPAGRWLVLANKRVIRNMHPYPCMDGKGNYIDEPVLHKLSYAVDPGSDRDMGLVRHLLDAQRTVNDAISKTLEWKNLALMPQVFVTPGMMGRQRLTDEPGAMYQVPNPDQNIKWREVPPVPRELFEIADRAKDDMGRISAQNDVPSQVESGKALSTLVERDQGRRQSFIASLADFHSRLMRHCLYLVQAHYSEPRLLKIRGRFGPELLPDFMGSDLRNQCDIRVLPESIEPRTRAAIEQKILAFADRGWVGPEAAMSAINGGTAEKLVESYELDVARANQVIQKIKAGPEQLFSQPMRMEMGIEVPGWMPRKFDNLDVHRSIFEDWMKTVDYDTAPPEVQEAANLYYDGLEQLEQQKMAQQAQAQMEQAESLGMSNAAKDGGPPTQPDQPNPTPDPAGPPK